MDSKDAKECKLDRSRRELSNEYLIANSGFDTAENESLKVCRKVVRQLDELSETIHRFQLSIRCFDLFQEHVHDLITTSARPEVTVSIAGLRLSARQNQSTVDGFNESDHLNTQRINIGKSTWVAKPRVYRSFEPPSEMQKSDGAHGSRGKPLAGISAIQTYCKV